MEKVPAAISARYHFGRKALKIYNEQLKEIGNILEIDTRITSYTARYSYTNVLVQNNVPVPLLQQTLGHSSIATTQSYNQKFTNSELDKTDWLVLFNEKKHKYSYS